MEKTNLEIKEGGLGTDIMDGLRNIWKGLINPTKAAEQTLKRITNTSIANTVRQSKQLKALNNEVTKIIKNLDKYISKFSAKEAGKEIGNIKLDKITKETGENKKRATKKR